MLRFYGWNNPIWAALWVKGVDSLHIDAWLCTLWSETLLREEYAAPFLGLDSKKGSATCYKKIKQE